jgi:hypothetical protein
MHDHPKGDPALTTHDEDDREEGAALRLVLELHPAALTLDELDRELTGGGSRDFSELDATRRGRGRLAGSGLLHRPDEDETVRPTRAAVRLFDLWER